MGLILPSVGLGNQLLIALLILYTSQSKMSGGSFQMGEDPLMPIHKVGRRGIIIKIITLRSSRISILIV